MRSNETPGPKQPNRHLKRTLRGLFIGTVGTLGFGGCISPDSPLIQDSAEGCREFKAGEDIDPELRVDPGVRAFMQASSDFVAIADELEQAVLTACANIALDLGAADTWSGIEPRKEAISNASGTGACDAAGQKIEDIMVEAGTVNAAVAIAVSRGQCHFDFARQAECDAACAANAVCDSGTVETRCEPATLSVMCSASCEAGGICVGTPELPANCMGKCESTCQGECKGTCIDKDGRRTENNPNCQGKCAASCNGVCRGQCKIDAPEGVTCGASVRCTGGCSTSYTDPVCVSEFKPPTCTVDAECHAACTAEVTAEAKCDPTTVEVFVDVATNPTLDPLVETLQENLPPLIDVAEIQGKLLVDAAHRLGRSGDGLSSRIESLDGKSLACLGESGSALGVAIGKIDVASNASVQVTVKLEGKTL